MIEINRHWQVTLMKTKRKNQPRQKRIGLLLHTALFLFGTAFYMMWWATVSPLETLSLPQLIGFLVTWLVILLLHIVSVPFFKRMQFGQSLWWRPEIYRGRHFLLDANVAFFMATFGFLTAWIASQLLTPDVSPSAKITFGLMLMLPLWMMGILVQGHQVLLQDIEAEQAAQMEDVSSATAATSDNDNPPVEETEAHQHQSSH
jgi:hypothetical protein